ncbi:unnamed protein product [Spirodela intermedia]|uniref:Uncharacterized protein n=1 Tax=Spirodela intermedia TaxID=51605 RepID=A0A7I8KFJ8_SPIIN|nr:unnamed protein product [Spirodela intermedia]
MSPEFRARGHRFPPTKTTGTAEGPPRSCRNALSMSAPRGSSSSSYTVGFTPIPQKSRFTATWKEEWSGAVGGE